MEHIINSNDLIIGQHYIMISKLSNEMRIMECKCESNIHAGIHAGKPNRNTLYFGNHISAASAKPRAFTQYDIYGPIELPDFDQLKRAADLRQSFPILEFPQEPLSTEREKVRILTVAVAD